MTQVGNLTDHGGAGCRYVDGEVRCGGTTMSVWQLDEVVLDWGPIQGDNDDDEDRVDSLSAPVDRRHGLRSLLYKAREVERRLTMM